MWQPPPLVVGVDEEPGRRSAYIFQTGALNPMHSGHVEMLSAAKAKLESVGYVVRGMWVSPSHDYYVQKKRRNGRAPIALSTEFRLELCRRLTEGTGVGVGTWEACAPEEDAPLDDYGRNFPRVAAQLHELVNRVNAHDGGEVFYVCGSDAAKKNKVGGLLKGNRPVGPAGCVVVGRDGCDFAKCWRDDEKQRFFLCTTAHHASVSSTRVRKLYQSLPAPDARAELDAALGPAAARLLADPTPAERERFASDFVELGLLIEDDADQRLADRQMALKKQWTNDRARARNKMAIENKRAKK